MATTKTQTASKTTSTTSTKPARTDIRNGVRPPQRVGTVLTIWTCFEETPKLTTADLPALAEEQGWNLGLVRSWFRQWKQWHGVTTAKTTTTKASAKG